MDQLQRKSTLIGMIKGFRLNQALAIYSEQVAQLSLDISQGKTPTQTRLNRLTKSKQKLRDAALAIGFDTNLCESTLKNLHILFDEDTQKVVRDL